MKTISINLYSFDELSEQAKQKALDECRPTEVFWADENRQSMEKFADIFPIKITDWSYGGRGEGVSFRFTQDNPCEAYPVPDSFTELEDMSGQRLATYIWNNYKSQIFKGKYIGCVEVDKQIKHKRVKSQKLTGKGRLCDWFNPYYSAITLSNSCVLTGYCMDDALLMPIYDFLKKPDSRTFKELLQDCFDAWIKACNADIDYQNSEEAIKETIESNDYTFEADGTLNNG